MEIKTNRIQRENKHYTLEDTLKNLLGSLLGLIGFFLLIILYKENYYSYNSLMNNNIFNINNLADNVILISDMTYKFFSDIRDFAIQSSEYINKVGFSFSNFFLVYKTFVKSFSHLIPMLLIYVGLYIKQREGAVLFKITKIFTGAILIFGTAILISIALNQ